MTMIGTWNSSYGNIINDWKQAIKFMTDNQELLKKLITHTYKLEEYEEAFNLLKDKSKFKIKVMFEVGEDNGKR